MDPTVPYEEYATVEVEMYALLIGTTYMEGGKFVDQTVSVLVITVVLLYSPLRWLNNHISCCTCFVVV